MNLPDLEAFIALAETGSISRAAARLHITQSAVSRRLKNLEASVKARLLDRNAKPPRITEDGMRLVQEGRALLHRVSELVAAVGNDPRPQGKFRLGIAPGIAEEALGTPLDDIVREFPGIQLTVRTGWSGGLVELVRTGELDAAAVLLTEPAGPLPDLSARPLAVDRIVVVASISTKLAASPSLKTLSALPWVLNPKGCTFRQTLERSFVRAGLSLRLCAEMQGYELQMSLISRGVGLGIIPASRVRSSRHRNSLRELDVPALATDVTSALVWPASQDRLLPVLETFHRAFKRCQSQHAQAA